jgi:hypothetical protein
VRAAGAHARVYADLEAHGEAGSVAGCCGCRVAGAVVRGGRSKSA